MSIDGQTDDTIRAILTGTRRIAPLAMVDLFRNSVHVGPIVDAAIRLGAKVIWMQLGVIDQAAAWARDAGLTVVMGRCPVIAVRRLGMTIGPRADEIPSRH